MARNLRSISNHLSPKVVRGAPLLNTLVPLRFVLENLRSSQKFVAMMTLEKAPGPQTFSKRRVRLSSLPWTLFPLMGCKRIIPVSSISWEYVSARNVAIISKTSASLLYVSSNPGVSIKATFLPSNLSRESEISWVHIMKSQHLTRFAM